MERHERDRLYMAAGQAFQPATPVQERRLFAGRLPQIARVADAVGQTGLHVAIYGERGVGKTSLANILSEIQLNLDATTARVNCDVTDTFGTVWEKLAARVIRRPQAGFSFTTQDLSSEGIPPLDTPDMVLRLLDSLENPAVCIFDEFDRLQKSESSVFSDLIKGLSDSAVPSTVILVGVAETVTDLVEEHASIERALVQVEMPRMAEDELQEILTRAAEQLDVTFTENAVEAIVKLSQGLPHYTHLLGRESVRAAARRGHRSVGVKYVREGIKTAVQGAQETIREQYSKAVWSTRDDALYVQVLLSCAMAEKGERSTFRAADVTKPMTEIMGRTYGIPAIARHLKAFCEEDSRARVLTRSGGERRYVYRFRNPLMESYVLMRGIADGLIDPNLLGSTDPGDD